MTTKFRLLLFFLLLFGALFGQNKEISIYNRQSAKSTVEVAARLMDSNKLVEAAAILEEEKLNTVSPVDVNLFMKLEQCYSRMNRMDKLPGLYVEFDLKVASKLFSDYLGVYLLYKFFSNDFWMAEHHSYSLDAIDKALRYFEIASRITNSNNLKSLLSADQKVSLLANKANTFRLMDSIERSKLAYEYILRDHQLLRTTSDDVLADIYAQYAHLFSRTEPDKELELIDSAIRIYENKKIVTWNYALTLNQKYLVLNRFGVNSNSVYLIEKSNSLARSLPVSNKYEANHQAIIISYYIQSKVTSAGLSAVSDLYQDAIVILSNATEFYNPSYILLVGNAIYTMGNLKAAKEGEYFVNAGQRYLKQFSKDSAYEAGNFYNNVSNFFNLVGNTELFGLYASKAYYVLSRFPSSSDISLLTAIGPYSRYLSDIGQKDKSLELLKKAVEDYRDIKFGAGGTIYNSYLLQLALSYFQRQQWKLSSDYLLQWQKFKVKELSVSRSILLNYDFEESSSRKYDLNVFYWYGITLSEFSIELAIEIFNSTIINKNFNLKTLVDIRNSANDTLIESYMSLRRNYFSHAYKTGTGWATKEKAAVAKVQFELVKHGLSNQPIPNFFEQIKQRLVINEAYLEILSFNLPGEGRMDSLFYYACLITQSSRQPELYYLFRGYELQKLIEFKRAATEEENISGLYDTHVSGSYLFNLFFAPFVKKLNNITRVYVSGISSTSSVNLGALPFDEHTRVNEKWILTNVSSTLDWLLRDKTKQPSHCFVFGGIDYDYVERSTNIAPLVRECIFR